MKLPSIPNGTGWALLFIGLATMIYAHHVSFDKLEAIAGGLITAATLAIQVKPHEPTSPKAP